MIGPRTSRTDIVLRLIPGVALAIVWEASSHFVSNGIFRFGSPSTILVAAWTDLRRIELYKDIAITATETVLGLLCGSILGTFSGLLLWSQVRLASMFRPYIVIAGSIPVFALAPILINWFGTGLYAKVVIASLACFFVALAQAYEGAGQAQLTWIEIAETLHVPRWRVIRVIIFPSAASWVLSGMRLNVSFALIGAFIGEFISSEAGLGRYILKYGALYDIPRVFVGVGLMALMATTMNELIGRTAYHWTRRGDSVVPR